MSWSVSQIIIALQLSTMLFMIWHEQPNIEMRSRSPDSRQQRGRNIRLTARNTCSKTVVDACVSNAQKKKERKKGRTPSIQTAIQDKEEHRWPTHQELDAWFFFEWDVNIFISESLRLTSMPTLIAWKQDIQQKEPRWDPEDDLES